MITSTTKPRDRPPRPLQGFSLLELMIASTLAIMILAAVMQTHLQLVKSGLQLARHAEMEAQVRRGLEQLGNDLRNSTDLVWNSDADITLKLAAIDGTTSFVTYAWNTTSQSLFRVPGSSSASNTGRIYLITGIPSQAGNTPGLSFARFDRNNAPAATNQLTKRIQVSMIVVRDTPRTLPAVTCPASASFNLRNKPGF